MSCLRPPILAALLASAATALPLASESAESLLTRMAAVNPDLRSFKATLHAHVALRSFPFLSTDLVGTYYYRQPDKNKVVFNSGVPSVDQQFDKLYARIESPSQWMDLNTVTVVSDDGKTTTFNLVPRKHGNVDRIVATADDKSATVESMRWEYANGGYAEMTNHYERIDGNLLVTAQSAHVDEPSYSADVTSTIDNYTINPALPDSVFAQP